MSSITQNLLSKYYGFGEKIDIVKSVSVHESINSLEIHDGNVTFDRETSDLKEDKCDEKETRKDENCVSNLEAKSNSTDESLKSSRVLDENSLADKEVNTNLYEEFLRSKGICNDLIFQKVKPLLAKNQLPTTDEKLTAIDNKFITQTRDETTADPNSALIEDILPDNVSDISYSVVKKRSSRTLKTPIAPLPPVPKKTPSCNDVYLDLTNDGIVVFPANMLEKTPNLRMLYLDNNKLTELPDEVFLRLKNLEWLDVRNNQLTTLPAAVKGHPRLQTILLQGNNIEHLPVELALIPKLKELQVTRNPLVFPSAEVVALGCAAILKFLRKEWEKMHPEEAIQSFEGSKPNPSTILCYQPTAIPKKKPIKRSSTDSFVAARVSNSMATNLNRVRKPSVREKTWGYRPGNRCESKGLDIMMQQRLICISKVKEMLQRQSVMLQKIKSETTLKDWRNDHRSFKKSMDKASRRTTDDIPFAVSLGDGISLPSGANLHHFGKTKKRNRKVTSPTDLNKNLLELYESLNQLQLTRRSETLTPRTEQKLLEDEINKITMLQNEVQCLRRHNEIVMAPYDVPRGLLIVNHHTTHINHHHPSYFNN